MPVESANIERVERLATGSRAARFLHHPFKYILALGFRCAVYPFFKKGWMKRTTLFFGPKMKVILPAGTDLYLTGGKTHDSEIRLARFLMHTLSPRDTFIDIGAHFGYFTLLAAELVKPEGSVFAFEAAKNSFLLLQENVKANKNINVFHLAVSDERGEMVFYEFPAMYSEYNSTDVSQYENESWFIKSMPAITKVTSVSLDDIIDKYQLTPKAIKIDVEGAEYKVLKGAVKTLKHQHPIVIMEYLSEKRGNREHHAAKMFLESLGYSCHIITAEGVIVKAEDIDAYLKTNDMDSDNLVFIK